MSNKTQLQTNNTKLASLIETLQGKAAGGGAGGSVGVCSVILQFPVIIRQVYYTSYDNGETNLEVLYSGTEMSITLNNVLCNSFFQVITRNDIYTPIFTIDGGGEALTTGGGLSFNFKATNTHDGTMTVDVYDDD